MVDNVTMKPMTNPLMDMTFDLAFKMFFKENTGLLISILQDFLPLPEGYKIADVILIDGESTPTRIGGKTYQLDLRVKLFKELEEGLEEAETVIVEMQTTSSPYFLNRISAYAARDYSSQLDKGKDYRDLRSVYSLVFTTQNLSQFKGLKDYYHVCNIRRADPPHLQMSDALQFILVELDKFVQELADVTNQREAWCWFLKYSRKIQDENIAKELGQKGESMGRAVEQLRVLSADERLKAQLEAEQKRRLDEREALQTKYDEGIETGEQRGLVKGEQRGLVKGRAEGEQRGLVKGEQRGLVKGRAEGEQRGLVKGEQKGRKDSALRLLKKGMEIDFISEVTGLSIEEVKRLKN